MNLQPNRSIPCSIRYENIEFKPLYHLTAARTPILVSKSALGSSLASTLIALSPENVPPVAIRFPFGHKFPDEHHASPFNYNNIIQSIHDQLHFKQYNHTSTINLFKKHT